VTTSRHLLLVASQCAEKNGDGQRLGQLEVVARELDQVLRDPRIGGFGPGLADGTSLLLGDGLPVETALNAETIKEKLQDAIVHAAEHGAVLGLGFLGHGFIVGDDPRLHFMAWDSTARSPASGIDISAFLLEAADRPGIRGVLAVIDTCHAGGGVPSLERLYLGVRRGQGTFAVLAGTLAHGDAYDLNLSRELVRLLRRGIPGQASNPVVDVTTASAQLAGRLPGQLVTPSTHGDQEALWIAANLAQVSGPAITAGPGSEELRDAVTAWRPGLAVPDPADLSGLSELRSAVKVAESSPQRTRVLHVLDCLHVAQQTKRFLSTWPIPHLTSTSLRRAFAAVDGGACGLGAEDGHDLGRTLERVALTTPVSTRVDCRPRVVQYVFELVRETGYRPADESIDGWAQSIGAQVLVTDALAKLGSGQSIMKLRLIVVLSPAEIDDWPESIECWLLNDSTRLDWTSLQCMGRDRTACEATFQQAVNWAFKHEELGPAPCQIEVAAPASLLLQWWPETCRTPRWLGVDHEVVLHWSGRIPLGGLHISTMRQQLKSMAGPTQATPVDWLDRDDLSNREDLANRLQRGHFVRAIALKTVPANDVGLHTLLLENTPILIWPHGAPTTADHVAAVKDNWYRLPSGFTDGYRKLWKAVRAPLGDLRAVWDDDAYLEFAAHFPRLPRGAEPKADGWTS
jgi:hypothetical protein